MVFRREGNKVDSFQRQMNALRQQIGDEEQEDEFDQDRDRYAQAPDRERGRRPPADEGYSFGNLPSPSQGDEPDYADESMPAVPEMPQPDQQASVIAAGTSWDGDLESDGSIHIHGRLNGSVRAASDIWIADGAEVDATIEAERVVVGGDVNGRITARARFEALPSCDVQADVEAPTFVVHEGATLNGQLSMTGGSTSDTESREYRNRPGSIIQRRRSSS